VIRVANSGGRPDARDNARTGNPTLPGLPLISSGRGFATRVTAGFGPTQGLPGSALRGCGGGVPRSGADSSPPSRFPVRSGRSAGRRTRTTSPRLVRPVDHPPSRRAGTRMHPDRPSRPAWPPRSLPPGPRVGAAGGRDLAGSPRHPKSRMEAPAPSCRAVVSRHPPDHDPAITRRSGAASAADGNDSHPHRVRDTMWIEPRGQP
jgi:hypothetical protein